MAYNQAGRGNARLFFVQGRTYAAKHRDVRDQNELCEFGKHLMIRRRRIWSGSGAFQGRTYAAKHRDVLFTGLPRIETFTGIE